MQNEIRNLLLPLIVSEPFKAAEEQLVIEQPRNNDHGDYATNIALRLAKGLKRSPQDIAEELAAKLAEQSDLFEFSVLNGFLNIKLTDRCLLQNLSRLDEKWGSLPPQQREPIILEYVSANPTGPLHIGHGRWAVLGDILARVLSYRGFQVYREFYVNDAGQQIKNFVASIEALRNNQEIPEDGYHGEYVKELAAGEPTDYVEQMRLSQEQVLGSLGVEFDNWFSEQQLIDQQQPAKVLADLKQLGCCYEAEGALWFSSEQFGDEKDRVLVKANGESTYFLSDIAYHQDKLSRGFTTMVNIWGADHHGYINRVQASLKALAQQLPADQQPRLTVILGQLVKLFRAGKPVRLSKRTGEIITLAEVIEEIGSDATRYFLARRSADTTLEFNLDLALQQDSENPVYYVQYAHARISAILRSIDESHPKLSLEDTAALGLAERQLILKLLQLPEELEQIAAEYTIHRLPAYAEELAALLHTFYHQCRIIDAAAELKERRLVIIEQTKQVLAIVCNLLGITAPERM